MYDILKGPIISGELKLGIQTEGKHAWEQLFNFPRYGLGVFTGSIGNTEVLGIPSALYSFMDVALFRGKRLSFNNQMALGISFFHKQYHPVDNPLNLAIGSDLNVFFYYNVNLGIRLSKNIFLVQGIHFSHFSNGAIKMPNTGFYMLDYCMGVRYQPKGNDPLFIKKELPVLSDRNQFIMLFAGGIKQLFYDGTRYPMSTFSLGYNRSISRINKINLGTDVFYDASLDGQAEKELPLNSLIRQGFYLGHELLIDRVALVVQQGIYTYRKVNFHQRYYSRLALRYYFHKNFLANISLKSHWGKADFIEWGIGVIL